VTVPREPTPPGAAFYDDAGVHAAYVASVRQDPANAQRVMEEPALLDALGDVRGLRVLDLGCGDAALGRRLLEDGAREYVGVDGSERMVRAARTTLEGTSGRVVHGAIERFAGPPGAHDLVVSRLALHYVEDIDPPLAVCHAALAPGGRMVLTVVHPVMTAHAGSGDPGELLTQALVDDYFRPGPRDQRWLGGSVRWHHRPLEAYVAAFLRAGFALTAVGECAPRAERFGGDEAEFARRLRVPRFLLLAGRRD
jgi:SAM-dependent methyltransferase